MVDMFGGEILHESITAYMLSGRILHGVLQKNRFTRCLVRHELEVSNAVARGFLSTGFF